MPFFYIKKNFFTGRYNVYMSEVTKMLGCPVTVRLKLASFVFATDADDYIRDITNTHYSGEEYVSDVQT